MLLQGKLSSCRLFEILRRSEAAEISEVVEIHFMISRIFSEEERLQKWTGRFTEQCELHKKKYRSNNSKHYFVILANVIL